MRRTFLAILLGFSIIGCDNNCDKIRSTIILKPNSEVAEMTTLQSLESLKDCGFDSIDLELMTSQHLFTSIMTSLIDQENPEQVIKVEDYIREFNSIKENEAYTEYYRVTKEQLAFYSVIISSENLDVYIENLKEQYVIEDGESLKTFFTAHNFIDQGVTYMKGIQDFYLVTYEIEFASKNLSGVQLRPIKSAP